MLISANIAQFLAWSGRALPVRPALGALLFAAMASATAHAAMLALASGNGTPGGPLVTLPLTMAPAEGQRIASLQFDLVFDAAKLTPGGAVAGPTATAAGKSIIFNQLGPGSYRVIIVGFNNTEILAGTVANISFFVQAGVTLSVPIELNNALLASPSGSQVPVVVTDGAINTGLTGRPHHADINADFVVQITELLRPIQFYNSLQFHCNPGTEDGFAPGPGEQTCASYDSDYNPSDWRVGLPEVLRLVQFYNSGGYKESPAGEDGFAPK